ncbi:hypothetical protein EAS68_02935 [Legionella jordanis]|uniref:hypothetical protein n=1 Tax=Legionella jordanis TaxID=456 RepID=UPI000F00BC1D|nr:hypothetical protein [Legionella jordanis]RMX21725.1 hypothetical protein EAS68_02935 [Legionella jordanis]
MTKFALTDLLEMKDEHIYESLLKDDSLCESSDSLQLMSSRQSIELATKLMLACPPERMAFIEVQMDKLKQSAPVFAPYLEHAIKIKHYFNLILDPQQQEPQTVFTNQLKFDELIQFQRLSQTLANQHAHSLAMRILQTASNEKSEEVFKRIRVVFHHTPFSETCNRIAILKRLLEQLDGDTPYQAFQSRDFDAGLFHEFSSFVAVNLKNIDSLAERLANAPCESHSLIAKKLEQLNPVAYQQQVLFKEVNRQFGKLAESKQQERKLSPYGNLRYCFHVEQSAQGSEADKKEEAKDKASLSIS